MTTDRVCVILVPGKLLEFETRNFRAWKVLERDQSPGRVMEFRESCDFSFPG